MPSVTRKVKEVYNRFHKVDPGVLTVARRWAPGGLVLLGVGVDVGYGVVEPESDKEGRYVHDFGAGVKVYRRARSGEQPDLTYKKFPTELWILGDCLGLTYRTADGVEHEIRGSSRKKLCATKDGKRLAVIGPNGVEHVCAGGKMRVKDWIYD